MEMKKGNLSIDSENILPIIKKWLYSDSDIFLREIVSNGCDAINKLKKLHSMGEADYSEDEEFKVTVRLNKTEKTIEISDNGIGMTADEIEKYITQIAFSGASDFIAKYQDKYEDGNDIIGHFGLGFYSAFMVAETVDIDSLSYVKDSEAAKWSCDGGIEYEIGKGERMQRGTTITLHISEESKEFLDPWKIKEILHKYCEFMPVNIYFEDAEKEEEDNKPINDTNPLWLKKPGECSDEDYKNFYHKVFSDFNDPLFWIHLNMDYPFRLKGILYFPKLKHELESIEGQVKLFNNQVFIADNLKEVIPEFLLLLKGAIDCPDIPLNVSRSFLQNDGYVTKMSKYITKKVADKLNSLFKKEREAYEKFWEDISPFIKYGCMREQEFYNKIKDSLLFKTTEGKFETLTEYTDNNKDKFENKVFYVNDEKQQAQYIKLFKDNDMEAIVFDTKLDVPYINFLEAYSDGVKFARIDSDISSILKGDEKLDVDTEALEKIFKEALNKEELKIKVESLKSKDVSAMLELSEQSRRMQEMSAMYGMGNMSMPSDETLVLNGNNNVVKLLVDLKDNKETADMICRQIYDLAVMSNQPLNQSQMTEFIYRSNKILELLAEK